MNKKKLALAIEMIKLAVDFDKYKKEHPGTKKTKADPMFKDVTVYDNGGKSADRYTVVHHDKDTGDKHFYGMSEKPQGPSGFNQYLGSGKKGEEWGYTEGHHLGKKLKEVPEHLHQAIKDRIKPDNA